MSHQREILSSRRAFVQSGSCFLLSAGAGLSSLHAQNVAAIPKASRGKVRIGLVTDLHYADKKTAGSRHYRETLGKLEAAGHQFQTDRPDHVVELGDLIDAADSVSAEKKHLQRVNKLFSSLPGEKHYVLGNHCVHTLTKAEFLDGVERKSSYYSFDAGGFHFVVLDACFRSDGVPYERNNFKWTDPNIPQQELEWLTSDLREASHKTIVFVHQRLDVANQHGIKNAAKVRQIFEASGKVLAVFQGHSHKNDHNLINGIHYCVHRAMVEGSGADNNGFSTLDVFADGTIRVTGFLKQQNYEWT